VSSLGSSPDNKCWGLAAAKEYWQMTAATQSTAQLKELTLCNTDADECDLWCPEHLFVAQAAAAASSCSRLVLCPADPDRGCIISFSPRCDVNWTISLVVNVTYYSNVELGWSRKDKTSVREFEILMLRGPALDQKVWKSIRWEMCRLLALAKAGTFFPCKQIRTA
jgi:hypothetical protein